MLEVDVDDEDSLSERLGGGKKIGLLDIAVIRLPRLSNFTDFNPLERMEEVALRYVSRPKELGNPDLIILPGTKNTMDDLRWLRESGMETLILKYANGGGALIGICGGYQMLGNTVSDPDGVEGGGTLAGLRLLPTETTFFEEKTRTQVTGEFLKPTGIFAPMTGVPFEGYEIHMGLTTCKGQPLTEFHDQENHHRKDGTAEGNIWGCYVHGIFNKEESATALVNALLVAKGLEGCATTIDWESYTNQQYDKLAEGMRAALDMDAIYGMLEGSGLT